MADDSSDLFGMLSAAEHHASIRICVQRSRIHQTSIRIHCFSDVFTTLKFIQRVWQESTVQSAIEKTLIEEAVDNQLKVAGLLLI